MFGRGYEYLDYTVRPSEEGKDLLAVEALDRIEVLDGVEYLDGFELPPDNEDIWEPQTHTMHATHTYEKDGRFYAWQEVYDFDSTITNSSVREVNLRLVASGEKRLFLRWDEVDLTGLRPPRDETLATKAKSFFHKLVEKAVA